MFHETYQHVSHFGDLDARISKVKMVRNLNGRFLKYFIKKMDIKIKEKTETTHPFRPSLSFPHPHLASSCDTWQAERPLPSTTTCQLSHAEQSDLPFVKVFLFLEISLLVYNR
jgi:hypothetical protein